MRVIIKSQLKWDEMFYFLTSIECKFKGTLNESFRSINLIKSEPKKTHSKLWLEEINVEIADGHRFRSHLSWCLCIIIYSMKFNGTNDLFSAHKSEWNEWLVNIIERLTKKKQKKLTTYKILKERNEEGEVECDVLLQAYW